MQRKVEYETMDKDLNPEWHAVYLIDNNYVKRELIIDTPDSDTLFRVIDILEEWYQDLRLRKIERLDLMKGESKRWRKPKSNITLWDASTYTVDGFGDGIVLCNK